MFAVDRRIDDLTNGAFIMSIYRSRQERPLDDNTVQRARPNVVAATASGLPPTPSAQERARLRRTTPVDYSLSATIKWLKSLPPGVRPYALGAKYPRIVNLTAKQWNDDPCCRAYLDDRGVDHRGDRQGFPPDVYKELQDLHEYYSQLRPGADVGLSLA